MADTTTGNGLVVSQSTTLPVIETPIPMAVPLIKLEHPIVGRKSVGFKSPPPMLIRYQKQPQEISINAHVKAKRPLSSPSSSSDVVITPPHKRNKKTEMDAAMVAPLPIIDFIQSRVKPKACGYCELCQKPPCGKCKQCLLNAKGKTEKRRCAELKCIRFVKDEAKMDEGSPQLRPGDTPLPKTAEGISTELAANGEELAAVSAKLSRSQGGDAQLKLRYKKLLERKSLLHSTQASLRNLKSHRKSPFPVGFPEIWGIIAKLEKARSKFATFVVKQAPGIKTEVVERKRQKRDTLDGTIAEYCQLWSEELAPIDAREAEEFWKLIGKSRNIPSASSDEEDYEMAEVAAVANKPPSIVEPSDDDEDSYSSFSDED